MRYAIIDLGTNTFHLLIADVGRNHSIENVFRTRAVVKLGSGGIVQNRILDQPFRKGVKTMKHFQALIKEHRVNKIFAFATSAIRSSINGTAFVENVKEETGIDITIISGKEEATLIYYGIRQCVPLGTVPTLLMDIGGGSTEFIIASDTKIFWIGSFNIGVSRLLEQFSASDPIKPREIRSIEKYLEEKLHPLFEAVKKHPVQKLVGSSGSFDTLAEMIGFHFYNRNVLKGKTSWQFDLSQYNHIHTWLLQSTLEMRKKTKGLIRMRVDMIVISSICTRYIMKRLAIREMILSRYALKEGALLSVVN